MALIRHTNNSLPSSKGSTTMLVKFFKYGSGNGKSAFAYLLNHRVHEGTSRVLRGKADYTLSLIQSLNTKKKYKSGCLSFEEKDISAKHKEEIMDLFEETIFPGIAKENRNIVWIEHTDKNRLELNFVIPRVEISSYKAFNPYFHRVDQRRFSLFRDYINSRYQFSNPMDPKKAQTLQLDDMVKYSKNEHIKKLDAYLLSLIERNALKNRDELIYELKSIGYEITRIGKEYISIKTKDTKAIRLKGKYYKEKWDTEPEKLSNIHTILKALQGEIDKASKYNQKLFYKKTDTQLKTKKKRRPDTSHPTKSILHTPKEITKAIQENRNKNKIKPKG
ncbi:relaxase/mobilization nuclease domain-containing protein [Sulfurovum sp. CS9]|uniref:relaxase/mobilization nuclease domain-containing protein n=1 Tax=Sulfurovum sp. CS9 TaxID=3391146 RepID=UPI0039E951D3